MTDQEVYKETTVTIESPLLDEEVQEQMSKMARSTNAAKVSIGWEATEGGYFEVVYYIKKPRNK